MKPPDQREPGERLKNRLIPSRGLTPNAISLTELAPNLAARRARGWPPILPCRGCVHCRLDHGHAGRALQPHVRQGHPVRGIPRFHARPARGGHRADSGRRVLRLRDTSSLAVAAVVAALLFSLMVSYPRARAEALGVQCKVGLATRPGARRDPVDRAGVRARRLDRTLPASWPPPCMCSPPSAS